MTKDVIDNSKDKMNEGDLFREEVRNVIEEFLKEGGLVRGNKISIADFEVISTTENLNEVESTINRLIKKHKGFAEFRKHKGILDNNGVFG